ncbi:vasoactive intestinal polypeptide receptor 2 [Microcaecilia unicolor]|uniref:Vasoactive intestinal polypeptide receptor 2 n=1 Tax=Microcaecilia unicolor TaxID=1415580 RepID=A0A6P7XQ22_9AMPH|nr:vasoactive intestinal polypeptide receptor 2 [Microcaecilia unicolor]
MQRNILLILFKTAWILALANSYPECEIELQLHQERMKCIEFLNTVQSMNHSGCNGTWDNVACWHPAKTGETVNVSCPKIMTNAYRKTGTISKNCTSSGWSNIFPDIYSTCGHLNDENDKLEKFYAILKVIYTLGHSTSLTALITGSAILCLFRKLHCTRNYIHLNLFLSFILRAIFILVKDNILYSSSFYCRDEGQYWVSCKAVLVFFQYFIMANFYWLLVEGLYLHTLLVVIFSYRTHFTIYFAIGWGIPTIFIIGWIISRVYLEDIGCWDTTEHKLLWWLTGAPILCSIIVNFLLFINIVRILLQKLTPPDVRGSDQSQYKRLAKSTLLLIPLFGIHYIVFAMLPIPFSSKVQLFFELGVGSFQGLVVAILYCFLNKEVQGELKRKWHSMRLNRYPGHDYGLRGASISRNGSEGVTYFHRDSRTQSFQQTETMMA